MEKPDQLQILFHRYLNNRCSRQDVKRLMEHFCLEEDSEALKQLILDQISAEEGNQSQGQQQLQDHSQQRQQEQFHYQQQEPAGLRAAIQKADKHIYHTILKEETGKARYLSTWLRGAAAAIALLLIAGGGWYLFRPDPSFRVILQSKYGADIAPGGNRATLKLADGSIISLDETNEGRIAREGGAIVTKTRTGQLTYTGMPVAEVSYHTVSTPRGGQYHLVLTDGTKVWLNAASSITYPTGFNAGERRVEITGEAYFEVAPDKGKPFYVKSGNQEVQVLGTHFNIEAYEDERGIKTTLLEGKVRVAVLEGGANEGQSAVNALTLTPGEQSLIRPGSDRIRVTEVDPQVSIGWKNGYFIFNHQDIKGLMRKIARWYNVEVVYEGEVPEVSLGGNISRFENVSQILDVLESTGAIHFKVEGRRITVRK